MLPAVIIVFCLVMFLALYFGWFDCLTYSTCSQDLKGIDFFAVPKSFINLTEGRSPYDTWGGEQWGPYATWYLAHPAYSVFIASWFSFPEPWTSYWLFGFFTLALFIACGWIISRDARDPLDKRLAFFFLTCSMLVFAVIYTGNMHAPLVLSLTLILSGLFSISFKDEASRVGKKFLMAGLLISFFSKPIVILFMPLLLVNKITRKTGMVSLLIYGIISFLFLVVPALNPESIGIPKTIEIALDPTFVKENMNIYKNNFVLNEYMKDNSIHWLNLVAQSDFYWNHVDIFSLSSFVNTLAGRQLPGFLYKLPYMACFILSLLAFRIKNHKRLMEFTLVVISAITLTFFLGYNTVWEYQYALVLPLVAYVPILHKKRLFTRSEMIILMSAGVFFLLPNFFFLFGKEAVMNAFTMNMIRLDRVVPALIYFVVYVLVAVRILLKKEEVSKD